MINAKLVSTPMDHSVKLVLNEETIFCSWKVQKVCG